MGGRFKIRDMEPDTSTITKSWNLLKPLNVTALKKEICKSYSTLYYNNVILISYYPIIYGKANTTTFRSTITFSDSLKVYNNGYYENPYNVTWGGFMAGERIADLLPIEYVPKVKEKKPDKILTATHGVT